MKLKINAKKVEVSPLCISSMMSYGSMKFECLNCHHIVNMPWERTEDKVEYSKYCPYCGSEFDLSDIIQKNE